LKIIFFLSTPYPTRPSRPILLFRIRNDITTLYWNFFFFDWRLCPLDCSGLSYYQPARDSKPDPTRPDPTWIWKIFFRSTP
jgi:hypothetical protein